MSRALACCGFLAIGGLGLGCGSPSSNSVTSPTGGAAGSEMRGGMSGASASAPDGGGFGTAGTGGAGASGASSGIGGTTGVAGTAGTAGSASDACNLAADCDRTLGVDLCQGEWECAEGVCQRNVSTATDCSNVVAEDCHDVVCIPATGKCEQAPTSTTRACGDDYCSAGTCEPGTGECLPKVECAPCAACDSEIELCVVDAGMCLIDGLCYTDGQLPDRNGCLKCDAQTPTSMSPRDEGSACTLGLTCFTSFACNAQGTCEGDVPVAPPTPRPARPISGTRTGSAFAPAARGVLRPTFVWNDLTTDCGPATFDLQVDASCVSPADCAFGSPEIEVSGLSTTSYQPPTDLGVAVTPPVGTRYYWRVRACRESSCSDWSTTRYVDVGRAPHDYNGDGFSDLIISTYAAYELAMYWGSPNGIVTTPEMVAKGVENTWGSTGDVNGDGFSDLIFFGSIPNVQLPRLLAYYGSAQGLPPDPSWQLTRQAPNVHPIYAEADYDNDGYDDLISHPGASPVSGHFFGGSASGLPSASSISFVDYEPPAGAMRQIDSGDFNGDAISDLVASLDSYVDLHVWLSGVGGLTSYPNDRIVGIASVTDQYPRLGVGDTNGDFMDDITASLPQSKGYSYGVLYLFESEGSGFPTSPSLVKPDPVVGATDYFGSNSCNGELVGQDGLWDLVVSAPGAFPYPTLYVYQATNLQSLPPIKLQNVDGEKGDFYGFGRDMSVVGDLNGDGNDDLAVCDYTYQNQGRALVYYGPISANNTSPSVHLSSPYQLQVFCETFF